MGEKDVRGWRKGGRREGKMEGRREGKREEGRGKQVYPGIWGSFILKPSL